MKDCKRLKDPIYGYIEIPNILMHSIVDSSSFQRLRRIIQTSYSPLYSSAVHNRFVHSLGVFHLGEIASNTLCNDILNKKIDISPEELEKTRKVFKLACLLHDVGHAPFSHTGEEFYLDADSNYCKVHDMLKEYVGSDTFSKDIPEEKSQAAAPHEIMSAIVGIKEFGDFLPDVSDKELFARCITGYKYLENDQKSNILNCFIDLLNSEVIDVDRLDYLIRDAKATGFDTVNIDYERLLKSIAIIDCHRYKLGYYKGALSVIENAVYAHDAEKKWIQSHPVILYESYIIEHIILKLNEGINKEEKQLFSLESLGASGQEFESGLKISLMCDDDIIHLMKKMCDDRLSKEFFERKNRRHPLWKSESEYLAYFKPLFAVGADGKKGEIEKGFDSSMNATIDYLRKKSINGTICEQEIKKLEEEICKVKDAIKVIGKDNAEAQLENKTKILAVMKCFQDFAIQNELECDFVILQANQFRSGFGKLNFSKTQIVFKKGEVDYPVDFDTVASPIKADKNAKGKFYYLFYRKNTNKGGSLEKEKLFRSLIKVSIL